MSPDACREWRAALASAAIGRIDDADDIALRAHLDGCRACRDELASLQRVARVLPEADLEHVEADAVEPASSLADQVLESVARERAARRRQRARVGAWLAAAVIVAAVGVASVVATRDGGGSGDVAQRRVEFTSAGEGAATATLTARPEGTEVTFHASNLDDGEWYWLWTTGGDDRRVPAGTFQGNGGPSELHLVSALPLDDTTRVWVTDSNDEVVFDAWLRGAPE
jgi:hypothetical protein